MTENRFESIDRVAVTQKSTPCPCECHEWPELNIDPEWNTNTIERSRKDRRGRTLCSLSITDNSLLHHCRSCGDMGGVSTPKTKDPTLKCSSAACDYYAAKGYTVNDRRLCRECYPKERYFSDLAERGWCHERCPAHSLPCQFTGVHREHRCPAGSIRAISGLEIRGHLWESR